MTPSRNCAPRIHWLPLRLGSLLTLSLLALATGPARAPAQSTRPSDGLAPWPQRVLLTNDDGIQSPALRALARAFAAAGIETYVAAPSRNRSGMGSLMISLATDSIVTQAEDLEPGITAWAVDAFPADCVLFALRGPMQDDPPDLVVSGPNIGANVGEAWFISGTIGAARAAAYFGVPAVAISGADPRDSLSMATIARWVVSFVRSEPVRRLRAPEYLNVNVPTDPRTIRGVTVAGRARVLLLRMWRDTATAGAAPWQVWRLSGFMGLSSAEPGTDAFAVTHDSVSIQALRVGEQDPAMATWLRAHLGLVPRWPLDDTTRKAGGKG